MKPKNSQARRHPLPRGEYATRGSTPSYTVARVKRESGSSQQRDRQTGGDTQRPNLLGQIMFWMTCVLTVLSVVFALTPASSLLVWDEPIERQGWIDEEGNSFTGLYLPRQERYVGEVRIEFADGALYEGGLEGGRFSGQGHYTNSDGKSIEGLFVNGRLP